MKSIRKTEANKTKLWFRAMEKARKDRFYEERHRDRMARIHALEREDKLELDRLTKEYYDAENS